MCECFQESKRQGAAVVRYQALAVCSVCQIYPVYPAHIRSGKKEMAVVAEKGVGQIPVQREVRAEAGVFKNRLHGGAIGFNDPKSQKTFSGIPFQGFSKGVCSKTADIDAVLHGRSVFERYSGDLICRCKVFPVVFR